MCSEMSSHTCHICADAAMNAPSNVISNLAWFYKISYIFHIQMTERLCAGYNGAVVEIDQQSYTEMQKKTKRVSLMRTIFNRSLFDLFVEI